MSAAATELIFKSTAQDTAVAIAVGGVLSDSSPMAVSPHSVGLLRDVGLGRLASGRAQMSFGLMIRTSMSRSCGMRNGICGISVRRRLHYSGLMLFARI